MDALQQRMVEAYNRQVEQFYNLKVIVIAQQHVVVVDTITNDSVEVELLYEPISDTLLPKVSEEVYVMAQPDA